MINIKKIGIFIFLLCLLIMAVVVGVSLGAVQIPIAVVANLFLKKMSLPVSLGHGIDLKTYDTIIFSIRLPRVVLAAVVGAALATAGVVFQGLFKNPMADPYIIGVSAGAALGATLMIVFGAAIGFIGIYSLPSASFIGAIVSTIVVYQLARTGETAPISSLLLSGMAISSFLSAIISFIMTSTAEDLQAVIFWLMGGFTARNWIHVKMTLPFVVVGIPLAFVYARELNAMLLGDEKARHLGVEVEKVKKILLVVGSMLAAAAVSVSGLIGFVGLMTPHAVRLIIGPDNKMLIPCSALVGAIFLIIADILARMLLAPMEIPVGIITALFGAPFFIYLLSSKKRTFL